MTLIDKDLQSIQEVRLLIRKAKKAQKILAGYSQTQIDTICQAVSEATYGQREKLAKMAHEETGFGIWQDKVIKNTFASQSVYEYIKDMKTVGVIEEDLEKKITEIAVPMGVIAGLIPSTNPTSTVIYKALISLKAGNSIVFSPHPNALKAIIATVEIIKAALEKVGAPTDCVSVMTLPTMQGTQELMTNRDTNLILATGGNAMVRAAYSSGTPAIGVGPGNGPAYIERSANVKLAVQRIMDSKTFDNGTICASEQSIIVEEVNKQAVHDELIKQGAYFLTSAESEKLSKFILRPNGTMNPQIVGRSVQHIAEIAGLNLPQGCRLIVAEETNVGHQYPYSREKLAPIIAFYTVENWQAACELSVKILEGEGVGHTMTIHTENREVIRAFGLQKPVSRLLVNTPAALGGIGGTTDLVPALTLGCGTVGGSSTSDNIGPQHLFNIRRVAYGTRELSEIREAANQCATATNSQFSLSDEALIETLVTQILAKLQ
ncbi:acetaldehyde dehydrogenase (acetylating) [Enterococcus sp. PF1-24]|uniref:acetaldehyde dehydrogenase (acetylating) n=1 Tax=unclassified Enterococcus TaxID=2608891 RepID=UPI002473807D|nr:MULTISPECIES: acetaldehyde dehydrogenase (acetylating) [unclassified Enterococcus]MDH6363325.1 acetaldehyde dehydrogenase (acetylating) [Enterococcus sp. PFB1-1]MDH6400374.1 acetaldehyde dehydrogenase (acetylating) [Enterococcus sp. PF1-24]